MNDARDGLLLSVKPQFAKALLRGEKTVELRRVRPRSLPGDRVVIYEAAPTMAIKGHVTIRDIYVMSPTEMWTCLDAATYMSANEYWRYFAGAKLAVAIHLIRPVLLEAPITLSTLRQISCEFRPPRSFQYLSSLPEGIRHVLRC